MSDREHRDGADPATVMQLSTAYWGSQVLFTANRIGLFPAVASGCHTPTAIATACAVQERPLQLLLQACVALGLLDTGEEGFRVSAVSDMVLVPGNPAYLGDAIRYSDDLYATWGQLEQALREDRPQLPTAEYTGDDSARTRHFVRGMHDRALGIGRSMIDLVDLSGRTRLLDVGGGPGTYSALFTGCTPGLHATVLDLPGVVAIAREIVAEMGMQSRVDFLPGDFTTCEFPTGNDAILISGVFHRESADGCRDLIRRAHRAMGDDGLLVIGDVFTDAGGCSPPFAAMFGLNMLLTAEHGGVHADADVAVWLREAGFARTEVKALPPPMPHRIVLGWKN